MKYFSSLLRFSILLFLAGLLQTNVSFADGGNGVTILIPHSDTAICNGDSITMRVTNFGYHASPSGISADDGYSGVVPIGFNFKFYGNTYNKLVIGSNGDLCFDTAMAGGYDAWTISSGVPGNTSVKNCILGCYNDIFVPAGGLITYGVAGTAPYRRFVVNFCTVSLYQCTSTKESFQMVLYETTNVIESHIRYKDTCRGWNGGYAIEGVQNSTATAGTTVAGRNYPDFWWTFNAEGRRFTPDTTYSSYSVDSIAYNPVSQDTSNIYWYADTTFIGTGTSITVHPSTTTVYKAMSYSCSDTSSSVRTVIVNRPGVGPITGPTSVCPGASITLADTSTGGYWVSSDPTIATINTLTGQLTGLTSGTVAITYSYTNACGSYQAITNISVTRLPTAGSISGLSSVCVGGTMRLYDTTFTGGASGVWSSANTAIATISADGNVRGVSVGTTNITFTVTGTCGTAYVVRSILVTVSAYGGVINGASSVCLGTSSGYTDTTGTSVGVWSVSSTAIATITSAGRLTALNSGTVTISYTVSGSCGVATATKVINVITATAGAITGPTSVCVGSSITLSDTLTGGTWSVTGPSANINASTGVVTGVSAGTAMITYTYTGTCGTANTGYSITVLGPPAAPAAISGASSVCPGASITLTDATTGGIWSSSNTALATVNAAGLVTGVSSGSVTISYSVSNSCGSTSAIKNITVSPATSVSSISGPSSVCVGANITLTDATTGGTWSSSATGIASVNPTTGVVNGRASGTAVITYTVTGTCGAAAAIYTIIVTSVPSVNAISGISTICRGTTTTLTDLTAGGTWSSTTTSVATVSSTGVVTGVAAGTSTISYTVTNSCGAAAATMVVTINTAPTAGTISGATSVCGGTSTTLTSTVTGGVWSSSNTSVASVSSLGVVTGVAAGSATITYTITSTCGTASATYGMTVNPGANHGVITGASTVCTGATSTLAETVSGGTWSSSSTSIATVSSTGVVRGVLAGTVVITYTVSNTCGTVYATFPITVNGTPSVAAITGASTLCTGATTTLADATTGGTWSSSNTAIATVSSAGVVTGVSAGSVSISYTVSSTCGSVSVGKVLTVSGTPYVATITGATTGCVGTTVTLSDSTTGGTWSSSNTALATVSSTGVVRCIATGTVTISYTVSSSCASRTVTKSLTLATGATAGTISGLSAVCVGSAITLTSSGTSGGTWTSSNTSIATVAGGVVRGVAAGTINITYSVTTACGTVSSYKSVAVSAAPKVVSITGASNICVGTSSTYTDASAGGGWISSNTAIATVNSAGVLTGISAGTITLTYFITNACGTASTTKSITVGSLSAGVVSGASTLAAGASTTYTNTVSGGTWSVSSTTLGTVNATSGAFTAITAGIDTIKYTVTNVCGTAVARKAVTITAHKDNPTVSANTSGSDIKVYPNPSTGIFNVVNTTQQIGRIIITDATGKQIMDLTSNENQIELDLSNYAKGMYMAIFFDGEQTVVRKLVIE